MVAAAISRILRSMADRSGSGSDFADLSIIAAIFPTASSTGRFFFVARCFFGLLMFLNSLDAWPAAGQAENRFCSQPLH